MSYGTSPPPYQVLNRVPISMIFHWSVLINKLRLKLCQVQVRLVEVEVRIEVGVGVVVNSDLIYGRSGG